LDQGYRGDPFFPKKRPFEVRVVRPSGVWKQTRAQKPSTGTFCAGRGDGFSNQANYACVGVKGPQKGILKGGGGGGGGGEIGFRAQFPWCRPLTPRKGGGGPPPQNEPSTGPQPISPQGLKGVGPGRPQKKRRKNAGRPKGAEGGALRSGKNNKQPGKYGNGRGAWEKGVSQGFGDRPSGG